MQSLFYRLRNTLLALAAAFAYSFRRSSPDVFRTILVIQGAKMGDMVCTTPLFRAIKEKYPESSLLVMGNILNKELLAGNPYIDEYLFRPAGLFGLRQLLVEKRADFALSPGPDTEALLGLLLAQVPMVVMPRIEGGFSPYATKTYRYLCRFAQTVPHRMGAYSPREYLRL